MANFGFATLIHSIVIPEAVSASIPDPPGQQLRVASRATKGPDSRDAKSIAWPGLQSILECVVEPALGGAIRLELRQQLAQDREVDGFGEIGGDL